MVRGLMGVRWRRRRGLSLLELLVAMSILLVGIYAIVRGFPSLFGNIEGERVRTEMARLAEHHLERLKAEPERLPEAITGHDPADGLVINPDSWPDDDAQPSPPGNARDDLTWVLGETFRVPGPRPAEMVSVYPLNLGAACVQEPGLIDDYFQVFRLTHLQRLESPPPGGTVPDGRFYLDADGYLYAPSIYQTARVDYCWAETDGVQPVLHWVTDEVVRNVNYPWDASELPVPPVRAADVASPPGFANVLPQHSRAVAMERYAVAIGGPGDVAPGTAVLEGTFGATMLLPAEDAGSVMHVNYQLRTEEDAANYERRMPVMMEEITAPTEQPYQIDFKFRGVHDETPLYETDVAGAALDPPVYVLVVDLLTGETYTDVDPWVYLDMIEGRLTLDWDDPAAPMTAAQARGHDLRIYYRTLDGHQIVVQKAPEYFVEQPIRQTYDASGEADTVDYRFYVVAPADGDAMYTKLSFPEAVVGQAVMVDYLAGETPPYERISGEMHVVAPTGSGYSVVLTQPHVVGIMGVEGVSLTVRGWWHDSRGRPQMVSIDTVLTPEPLL